MNSPEVSSMSIPASCSSPGTIVSDTNLSASAFGTCEWKQSFRDAPGNRVVVLRVLAHAPPATGPGTHSGRKTPAIKRTQPFRVSYIRGLRCGSCRPAGVGYLLRGEGFAVRGGRACWRRASADIQRRGPRHPQVPPEPPCANRCNPQPFLVR